MPVQLFRPRIVVRHRHIQTLLPGVYRGREKAMRKAARQMVLTVSNTLIGAFTGGIYRRKWSGRPAGSPNWSLTGPCIW